jgi:hypothetical protein
VQFGEFRRILSAHGAPIATAQGVGFDRGQTDAARENRALHALVTVLWPKLDWPGWV